MLIKVIRYAEVQTVCNKQSISNFCKQKDTKIWFANRTYICSSAVEFTCPKILEPLERTHHLLLLQSVKEQKCKSEYVTMVQMLSDQSKYQQFILVLYEMNKILKTNYNPCLPSMQNRFSLTLAKNSFVSLCIEKIVRDDNILHDFLEKFVKYFQIKLKILKLNLLSSLHHTFFS